MIPIAVTLQESLFCLAKQGYRKFLAGACFVSSGILFYLYLGGISVPCWGQILSKHLRSMVVAPSSISSCSYSVSILGSSGSQRRETAATPVGERSAQMSER